MFQTEGKTCAKALREGEAEKMKDHYEESNKMR